MANDKPFKVKNGLQAGRYLLSNGVETAAIEAYNLAAAVYDSVSFSVTSQDTGPSGFFFKPDGTKMYVVGDTNNTVYEYNLSTAWNISTTSYVQNFSITSQEATPQSLFFKPDGTKMYVCGSAGDDVNEYTLSTAWNISTASYVQNFSVSAQDVFPTGLFFKPDGTKMYVVGVTGKGVNEYTLSTAWNISTASYVQNFSVASQETSPQGLFFKPDGTKMYITGGGALGPKGVIEYSLSTAWNISTASYVRNFSVSSQDTGPESLFFKPDGTKMYVIGSTSGTVYQYSTAVNTQTLDLSTGTTFSFTPSGATTVSFTNPPASGIACAFTLEVNNNGSAITWPASVKWHKATTPTSTSTKELYAFITTDGGTKYYGRKAAEELL